MAEKRKYTILSMVDLPSRDPKRAGEIDVLVSYRIGQYQTGMVRIPKKTFTEENMHKAVKEDIELKFKYVGKSFEV